MPGPIGTVDTAIVLIYFAVIVVMGVALSRRQNSTEEYFLGRRNMHWLMVGISVQASLMSTISYLSVPGEQIRNGLMFHAAQLGVFPAILVINFLLLPYFMSRRITTVYELLERRFDLRVRMVGVVIFMGLRIIWMGLVVYTASFALTRITGWELSTIIVAVAVVGTVYTWLGGLRAVVWTDVIQWSILLGGSLFCIGYIMFRTSTGLFDWWEAARLVPYQPQPLFDLDPRVRITAFGIIVQTFFAKVCLHGADQVAVQRYLSTPSRGAAGRSFLAYVGCGVVLSVVMAVLGLALTSFFPVRSPGRRVGGGFPRRRGVSLVHCPLSAGGGSRAGGGGPSVGRDVQHRLRDQQPLGRGHRRFPPAVPQRRRPSACAVGGKGGDAAGRPAGHPHGLRDADDSGEPVRGDAQVHRRLAGHAGHDCPGGRAAAPLRSPVGAGRGRGQHGFAAG